MSVSWTKNLNVVATSFCRPLHCFSTHTARFPLARFGRTFPGTLTNPISKRHISDSLRAQVLSKNGAEDKTRERPDHIQRKKTRTSATKSSLRRVAVEAQRSRDVKPVKDGSTERQGFSLKVRRATFLCVLAPHMCQTVTATCAAEQYDIDHVARILRGFGHEVDPYKTGLYPQVVHVALPVQTSPADAEDTAWSTGDLFVFPSGTVVAWAIPEEQLSPLVSVALLPAAQQPLRAAEEEYLDYIEDPKRDISSMKGDTIILGTKLQQTPTNAAVAFDSDLNGINAADELSPMQVRNRDTALTKIAFSSGLARSTKLAVLESLLDGYFESTKSIPAVLSAGGRMPFTRGFISQKTGQLLGIRAQLNLYSELTDSLPDLFWDSRHELGLEGYYDQVGKVLDTNIRIKILNEKMDYAQEIASVLREQLSERHGVRLEWIIIILIAVEVVFAVQKEVKEYRERIENKL